MRFKFASFLSFVLAIAICSGEGIESTASQDMHVPSLNKAKIIQDATIREFKENGAFNGWFTFPSFGFNPYIFTDKHDSDLKCEIPGFYWYRIPKGGINKCNIVPCSFGIGIEGELTEKDVDMLATQKNLELLQITSTSLNDAMVHKLSRLPNIKHIQLTGSDRLTSSVMNELSDLTSLETISLESDLIDSINETKFMKMKNLVSLKVSSKKLNSDAIKVIAKLPRLEQLYLNTQIDDNEFASICSIKSLRSLVLTDLTVTDKNFSRIRSLGRLRSLAITDPYITDMALDELVSYDLVSISLKCNMLTAKCGHVFCKFKCLTELYLESENLNDSLSVNLSSIKSLKSIDVLCPDLTDDFVRDIATLDSLDSMGIVSSRLTKKSCEYLSKCHKLKRLKLWSPKVAFDSTKYFRNLCGLEILSIQFEKIDDVSIDHLSQLKNLTTLFLGKSYEVSDRAIRTFSSFGKLQYLTFYSRNISDDCVDQLGKLKCLRNLNLCGKSKITTSGFENLRKQLPRCDIYGE